MRNVALNGNKYVVRPLREEDVRPGALLAGKFNRKVMRVVCFDGDDAILRNVRHPNLTEVEPASALRKFYDCIPEQ